MFSWILRRKSSETKASWLPVIDLAGAHIVASLYSVRPR